jgi:hypothetical protein
MNEWGRFLIDHAFFAYDRNVASRNRFNRIVFRQGVGTTPLRYCANAPGSVRRRLQTGAAFPQIPPERGNMRPLTLVAVFSACLSGMCAADSNALRYYYPVPPADPPQMITADVCVYGATPAGITAAIAATRMGKSAVLVEFGKHVGGMTTAGLSWTDGGKTAAGIATEFYAVVGARGFKPAAAEKQFKAMLGQAGVRVLYEQRLQTATKDGSDITQIAMENGNQFKARMFVDATYEGDLLAMAKVSYAVGREGNSRYGETLNGVHFPPSGNFFKLHVDPFRVAGHPDSGVLPGITDFSSDAPGAEGSGDDRVQAYNFRMYLAKLPDAIPFPKPPQYDAGRYELLLRYIAAGAKGLEFRDFMQLHPGDSNNSGGFSTDDIGASQGWPEGTYAEREKIFQEHVNYQQGFMYFLANDPRVPSVIRDRVAEYGLAKDNFTETGGWPHMLYVREGRRMIGQYVMTEHNCRSKTTVEDSIGLAEYNMDSHNVQRFVTHKEYVQNEGDVQVAVPHPYPVAYRAIVPKASECTNLLVPVALSATHIAYGSIRMEPVFMVLGQSAGTAAAEAIDQHVSVQKVDYVLLRERLLADHQNLDRTPHQK